MDILELLEQVSTYLGQLVQRYGSLGIAAAMFAESAGVPFASAVVILTSGTMIFSGKISFWSILLSSTVGITLGSICSYSIGYLSSYMGRLIKNSFWHRYTKKLDKPQPYRRSKIYLLWERYGSFSIFMGQFWGVTRTFISFPAGAMHMNILLFIMYTTLGGAIFSLFAIGFSIILTGAAGLLLKYFRLFLSLSPFIWLALAVVLAALVFVYRRKGLKFTLMPLWRRGREWFLRNRQ